jgi:hypothetical protein
MGGPSVISAEELADAVRNLNRTQVIQPDGTRKPVMHLWELVSNLFINNMHRQHPDPISQLTQASFDLKAFTNPTGSATWMQNIQYFIKNDGADDATYTAIPNGVLNTTAQTLGKKVIKIDWQNTHGGGPAGTHTRSMVLRFVEITAAAAGTTYTFTGSGNYNLPANWSNGILPPNPLPSGSTILINGSGACILNVPQTVSPGATFRVEAGKAIRVNGNLQVL